MTRPQHRLRSAARLAASTAGAVLAGALLVLGAGAADAAPAQSATHQVSYAPADTTW